MSSVAFTSSSSPARLHGPSRAAPAAVPSCRPSAILVGASTGGPQALVALVARLAAAKDRPPLCVTLHMPPDLVPVVATHVTRTCGVETRVVRRREPLRGGIVYFAPGDQHLAFGRSDVGAYEVDVKHGKLTYYCKPAVDMMFQSGAACFGARLLGVVLSGMGRDGLVGARAIVGAGGQVMAQDKASSAVWGMPGAIAKAELAAAVLPPPGIADEIVRRLALKGGAR